MVKQKNPTTALVLSVIIPGLGQIYVGKIGRGILFIILDVVFALLSTILIGIPFLIFIWIYSMNDAYKTAKATQSYEQPVNQNAPKENKTNLIMRLGIVAAVITAILIILFLIGLYSRTPNNALCSSIEPGYVCQAPVINQSGLLSFTLGLSTGTTQYNVEIACAATSFANGMPNIGSAANQGFGALQANGRVSNSNAVGGTTLAAGQTISVSNVICYTANQSPSTSALTKTGSTFSGTIWINSTMNPGAPSSNNLWYSQNIATVTVNTT